MITQVFSNSMIFPCMKLFLEVFHDFQSLWEPCICNEGAGLMAVNIRHGREKKKIESPPLEVY